MDTSDAVPDSARAIEEVVEMLETALAQLDKLQLHIAGAHVSYAIEFLTQKSDSNN